MVVEVPKNLSIILRNSNKSEAELFKPGIADGAAFDAL